MVQLPLFKNKLVRSLRYKFFGFSVFYLALKRLTTMKEKKALRTEKITKGMNQSGMTSEIEISFTLWGSHSASKSKSN